MSEDDLDLLFSAARKAPPEPSAEFLARVLGDAQAEQGAAQGRHAGTRPGMLERFKELVSAIGGWPALAGMATAAVTGLWIGISPPDSLIDPLGAAFGETAALSESLEFGEGFDFTQFEG